jgi:hypothetical protein
MFSLVKDLGIQVALKQEAVPFLAAFVPQLYARMFGLLVDLVHTQLFSVAGVRTA